MRILIADDDRDTLMTLGILLRSEGMEVRLAGGGLEVLGTVKDFLPDAVLLDLEMPDHDGVEIARQLTQRLGRRCPVLIAITAHNSEADRHLTATAGFRHHVAKPYDPDALLQLISSIGPRAT